MKEIWKDIAGYKNYKISSFGRVKSLNFNGSKKQKILVPYCVNEYLRIRLFENKKQKSFGVHRLVAMAFIPNPDSKPEVNHIDGDKKNNKVNNLEWVTSSENVQHAVYVLGKKPNGGRPKRKVKNLETGEVFNSIREASVLTGCNRTSIISCCKGRYASASKIHWTYL